APLGSIIKRGGLGIPFLVSILFFIVYYVLTMQGEKLAKAGTVSVEVGVWMADVILFGIGLFFLRQARVDARLFDNDSYAVAFDRSSVGSCWPGRFPSPEALFLSGKFRGFLDIWADLAYLCPLK
ncbi:MAG TPA: LptF/LptG family permease, partial [Flavisolibacter sp.]|nr:LptF/LptG family permease [Flavisolibacter sp.]